ncbi:MAG: hypothetical protein FWH05_06485 [Oscillospiraceae bacterium]|nr:hypothetical protein [Oscillospiraceae bacterium]
MKLKTSQKALIMILIIGAIFGLGYYFFIEPNLTKITKLQAEISVEKGKIAEAQALLAEEESTINMYHEAKLLPIEAQKVFFPELENRTYQRIITDLLRDAGYTSTTGVTFTERRPVTLTVPVPQEKAAENYTIKEYSLLEDTFSTDAGAIEGGEVVHEEGAKSLDEMTHRLHELLALHNSSGVSSEEKLELRDERLTLANDVRETLFGSTVSIPVVEGSFTLMLTNREYRDFLEYLTTFPQAVDVTRAEFRNAQRDTNERQEYNFTLRLFVVSEMQFVEDFFDDMNPQTQPADDGDEKQDEGDDDNNDEDEETDD